MPEVLVLYDCPCCTMSEALVLDGGQVLAVVGSLEDGWVCDCSPAYMPEIPDACPHVCAVLADLAGITS